MTIYINREIVNKILQKDKEVSLDYIVTCITDAITKDKKNLPINSIAVNIYNVIKRNEKIISEIGRSAYFIHTNKKHIAVFCEDGYRVIEDTYILFPKNWGIKNTNFNYSFGLAEII